MAAFPPADRRVLIGITAGIVLVDQITKALLRASLAPGDVVAVIPGCFNLVHGQNAGIVFGMFRESAPVFRLLGVLTIPLLVWGYVALPLTRWGRVAWAGVLGGATGNQVDRLSLGHVTDFLDWYVGTYHWYAFNVADVAIMTGVAAIIGLNLLADPEPPPMEPRAPDPV